MEWIQLLRENLDAVKQAPISFVVFSAAGFLFAYFLFGERLRNMTARAEEFKRRLDDALEDKKNSIGTVRNAQEHILHLEERLKRLEPARLSDRRRFIDQLAGHKGTVQIIHDAAAGDRKPLAIQLAKAFQSAGWGVIPVSALGMGNPPKSGISVQIKDLNNPSAADHALFSALETLNLPFEKRGGFRSMDDEPADAAILLTIRIDEPA